MLTALPVWAQNAAGPVAAPGVRWEELTAPAFVRAVERAASTAVLPIGIIEKHGPQLPLGTDLINVRELALRAAAQEYAIVFPPWPFTRMILRMPLRAISSSVSWRRSHIRRSENAIVPGW
jgi:creatinine amidohydrolase